MCITKRLEGLKSPEPVKQPIVRETIPKNEVAKIIKANDNRLLEIKEP